ncbi:MAG: hypothetical protein ABII97_00855 [Patescibacteria group bacterium]
MEVLMGIMIWFLCSLSGPFLVKMMRIHKKTRSRFFDNNSSEDKNEWVAVVILFVIAPLSICLGFLALIDWNLDWEK